MSQTETKTMKTETVEIEISSSTTSTKEVTLPIYRKDNCHAYKVISKDKCISVCHSEYNNPEIGVKHSCIAFCSETTQDCDRSTFDLLYQKVAMKLDLLATD